MDEKIINFDDTEIKEYKFYQNKSSIAVNDVNINKIVVFNKLFFGKQDLKYFIGYKHCYYLIKKEKIFIKYIEILEKVRNIIKKKFKGAKKLHFVHYLCVVIILFNTGLYKSTFSTDSFWKLVFCFSAPFCIVSNSMSPS